MAEASLDMPTITEKQCDDIIRYLQTEAFKDAVIKGPLIDDMVDLLNDGGFTIPTSSRGKVLLGTGGNTQRYAILKSDKVSLQQADQDSVDLGFTGLVERDDYTRNIQVKGKATTGTQKTSKVTPANVTPPSRALNATFFDHNGMMAKNILAIAATGLPDPGWIASAKKVASGINYTTEFPISVGASYIQGDRGINQALQGTAGSTPANVQTPTPAPPPPPAPPAPPGEEEEEEEETLEEVPEVTVEKIVAGSIPFADEIKGKTVKGYDTAKDEKRRLSISKWEERDKVQSGMYPYPLKSQPIYFLLNPASDDAALQLTNMYLNPADWDADPDAPTYLTPRGVLIVQQGKKIQFTTEADLVTGVSPALSQALTSKNVDTFTLKWAQPGASEKIELLECKDSGGEVIFKVIDGQIIELKSPAVRLGDTASQFLTTNQTLTITGKVMQITIGVESTSAADLGYPNGEWTESLAEWANTNSQTARILFYNTETEPIATVDVYEEDMPDVDGSTLMGDDVLARIAGQVSDVMDVATKYIKVFLDMDYAGAKTTDLFSGRVTDSDSRLTALIFPGDQIDLDIQGTNAELGLEDQLDKVTAFKEVKTSTPVPLVDSDGNNLGYDSVSDATLTFEHNGKTKVIQIPDINGELVGWDRNGEEVRGQVESIELHTGNAAAQYETQKMIRRSNRMSPSYNLPNPSATDQNATASVAFRIGRKYYVIGRRAGQPVLVEVDLNYQQEV